ncbi:phage protein NinX family protein [Providencia sp. PROV113]|uniref:phage protein NinX family protein n=1 Tax=Providencia sp. PROV113 TaxID=2949824 RepID=UPI002349EBBE|nr:phage protein NinX family protein [Providencia sp. PROV113]
MNKYTELSGFEINRRIAEMDTKNRYVYFEKEQTIFRKFNNGQTQKFNPCNYPEDALPIIIENKIAMNHPYDIWQCGSGWNVAENKNPLRACMESYLLMKDAENES